MNLSLPSSIAEEDEYSIVLEKFFDFEVTSLKWNHKMDLLAIVLSNTILEEHRISFKSQKVFKIDEKQGITELTFSPSSEYLAYTLQDGSLILVSTENGEKFFNVFLVTYKVTTDKCLRKRALQAKKIFITFLHEKRTIV